MSDVSYWVAFTAGVVSFLSPCVLPLLPVYITFITGMSFGDITQSQNKAQIRKKTAIHSLLFILGFSIVFVLLGASATYMGSLLIRHQDIFRKIGGIVVIILGVHFTGLFKLGFLQKEERFHLKTKPLGYIGSVLAGITFAFGWSPCIGPILSSILMYAATTQNVGRGMALLFVYSLGLGIPFFVCSLALNLFLSAYKKFARYLKVVMIVGGIFLIIIGLLIFTNNFSILTQYVTGIFE